MNVLRNIFRALKYQLIGFVIFLISAVVVSFINRTAGFVTFCAVVIYVITVLTVSKFGKKSLAFNLDSSDFMQTVSALVYDIDSPVMIVNDTNKIVWSNKEFDLLPEVSEKRISTGTSNLFNGELSYANLSDSYDKYVDSIHISSGDSFYSVRYFPLEHRRQKLFATVWYNKDNEVKLQKTLSDSRVRVAHIVVDNTNEITQDVLKNRTFDTAIVNRLISDWAEEFDAMLIEYDRDKYLMLFDNRYLSKMTETRFDIINRVAEATRGGSNIPITISIGVSSEEGSLEEKRKSADGAIASALQRGGAIAVVRTVEGEDCYGGMIKTVQRQTKIRSRLCKDLLCEHIPKSNNVIIMGHLRPDYDSIASNIGIAKLVQHFGVDYCIVADKDDSAISKVIDLISPFPEYKSVFVDPVYAQEMLTSDTLVVITDASNPDMFAAPGVYENASKVIVIDHHAIKTPLGDQVLQPTYIDPTASSASELVCEILELSLSPSALHPEEARVLLSGILLDTQYFSRDTGTRTYSACIFLKNAGADASDAKLLLKTSLGQYETVSKIDQRMEIYRDRFVISSYDEDINPDNKVSASKAADKLVEIEGITASFVLYTLNNGINLSARSDGSFNVANIASALGGGGHFQSAGALLNVSDIKTAIDKLKETIDRYIDESSENDTSKEEI